MLFSSKQVSNNQKQRCRYFAYSHACDCATNAVYYSSAYPGFCQRHAYNRLNDLFYKLTYAARQHILISLKITSEACYYTCKKHGGRYKFVCCRSVGISLKRCNLLGKNKYDQQNQRRNCRNRNYGQR